MVDYAFKENEYIDINVGIATKLSHENFININNNINYLYNKYKNGSRGILYAYKISEQIKFTSNSDSANGQNLALFHETPTISFEGNRIYLIDIQAPYVVCESIGTITNPFSYSFYVTSDSGFIGANTVNMLGTYVASEGIYPGLAQQYYIVYNSYTSNHYINNSSLKFYFQIYTDADRVSGYVQSPIYLSIRDIGEAPAW